MSIMALSRTTRKRLLLRLTSSGFCKDKVSMLAPKKSSRGSDLEAILFAQQSLKLLLIKVVPMIMYSFTSRITEHLVLLLSQTAVL